MTDNAAPASWRPGAPAVRLPKPERRVNWRRLTFLLLGLGLFALVYFSPPWPVARDPTAFPVTTAAFSPAEGYILTGASDGSASVWDEKGDELGELPTHEDEVVTGVFSHDGKLALTTSKDGTANISGVEGNLYATLEGHTASLTSGTFSPDDQVVLTTSLDGTARLWNLRGQELAVRDAHQGAVTVGRFSPDGQLVLTASVDHTVRLWDREGREVAVLDDHTDEVPDAVFSRDGRRILTVSKDATARVWDVDGLEIVTLKGGTAGLTCGTFSPDGQLVLTGAADGSARLFDVEGRELAHLTGHEGPITKVAFADDGRHIVTGSTDSTARLWDLDGNEIAVLGDHRDTLTAAFFFNCSRRLLTASLDGATYVWDLEGTKVGAVPEGTQGQNVALSRQAQLGLGLFLLAAVWWVFEVVPIGITSILIVTVQSLFMIRNDSKIAFMNCFDPSVWFIFGSLMIGLVFTKTGLTRRIAYRMLVLVGERTSMIYLGTFVLTSALTLIMAHTAVAATIFPLLMAIYALYDEDGNVSKFGKGLFMGMAYVAGAGSIITLLGAARGAVAIGFFREITKRDIGFFELTWYMLPVGALMTILLWGYFMVVYKPERDRIPGLREKARDLQHRLGPVTRKELGALLIVGGVIALLSIRALAPDSAFGHLHKSAVLLISTILFFVFKILTIEDLEKIPWNIILLFGGAMSIGFALWETGAARWLALHWLVIFQDGHWLLFVLGVSFFVLIMTNFIMNVAAIAISIPVALVIAPYLGVSGEVVTYAALVTAGMPFLCLVGAAPNAIAYESGQFTSAEFFKVGIPASLLLMVVLAAFVYFLWPLMGMTVEISV